jgi:hypothetical protein
MMKNNDAPKVSSQYYVYGLYEEGSEDPFYIGKAKTNAKHQRHENQFYEAKRGHKCPRCAKIRKIWANGKQVECWVLVETDDESFAYTEEIRLIAEYGTGNLTNLTAGGEGRRDTPEMVAERAYQAMLLRGRVKIVDERRRTGTTRKLV